MGVKETARNSNPYAGKSVEDWASITKRLVDEHPLGRSFLVKVTLDAWRDIFASSIGQRPYKVGVDFFPQPQIVSFFLHELIAIKIAAELPDSWSYAQSAGKKDVTCLSDEYFSFEIKASSSADIFGNRSYAQKSKAIKTKRKSKTGYYLAVNFGKWSTGNALPRIEHIRFGWIDEYDWQGQQSQTGQQARLSRDVLSLKLETLYKP